MITSENKSLVALLEITSALADLCRMCVECGTEIITIAHLDPDGDNPTCCDCNHVWGHEMACDPVEGSFVRLI